MVDPIVGLGAVTGLLALDPVKRLLGPSADILGAELAAYTKRRFGNAETVVQIAAARSDEHPEKASEAVSPRVLLESLNEGSKVDDPVAQQYFGGLLASSKSERGTDDSAVMFTSLLSTMSSFQIHLHFALYSSLRRKWLGAEQSVGSSPGRRALEIVITYETLAEILGNDFVGHLEPAMFNLNRLGLVDSFTYNNLMKDPGRAPNVVMFLRFIPTVLGCTLFLAAHGHDMRNASAIIQSDLVLKEILPAANSPIYAPNEIEVIDIGNIPHPAE